MRELQADVVIIGGGLGGCAAAAAATSLCCTVILAEETDWLGGQMTSQAVPPDEHPWIEKFGCTRRYRQLRNAIRDYYRQHYPLKAEFQSLPNLNPGGGRVSRLCCEPRVALAAIEQQLAWPRTRGSLNVLLRHVPIAAEADHDQIKSVVVQCLDSGDEIALQGRYFLDATELGDLLPLAGVEYVSGAEAQSDTGEPHARDDEADPFEDQAITWVFAMGHDNSPGANHVIDKPDQYEKWRDYTPAMTPAWSGRLLSWSTSTYNDPQTPRSFCLFSNEERPEAPASLFEYRQIVEPQRFSDGHRVDAATCVNWPQNDYLEGGLIDVDEETFNRTMAESKQLSLSLLYWLQTEAGRADGGQGYPGLYPAGELVGTTDGLAKYPYIRESRRIRAEFTVTEHHVGTEARGGRRTEDPADWPSLPEFEDSVGIGCYRIDLHPSTRNRNYIDISSVPFQIPLGALIPQRMTNLLAANKNIGTTHISNGCFRLHPVEWNIGEAAGLLAAWSVIHGLSPKQVRNDAAKLADFQAMLVAQGIEMQWPAIWPV